MIVILRSYQDREETINYPNQEFGFLIKNILISYLFQSLIQMGLCLILILVLDHFIQPF